MLKSVIHLTYTTISGWFNRADPRTRTNFTWHQNRVSEHPAQIFIVDVQND